MARTPTVRTTILASVLCAAIAPAGGDANAAATTIDFESFAPGSYPTDFLAAYGIPDMTIGGTGPGAGGPGIFVGTPHQVPSGTNVFIQTATSNDPNMTHSLTLEFDPPLAVFGLTRMGTIGGSSTNQWSATFLDDANTVLGSFGESGFIINASPLPFSFDAPPGPPIARMRLESIWNVATFRNIPVDDFVLTPVAQTAVAFGFDTMPVGVYPTDFLAPCGITDMTIGGTGPGAAGPRILDLAVQLPPSPPNVFIQHATSNDPNQTHSLTFEFDPPLTSFRLARTGTRSGSSTNQWSATFLDALDNVLGTFGESGFIVNAPPQEFSFDAPPGQSIARMRLESIWNVATFRNIPIDDFVLTHDQPITDCNENGSPDGCDIAVVFSRDCNGNGIPDECDLASDPGLDADGTGVLDSCEQTGDLDGSGTIGFADLNVMLGTWGACPAPPAPCPADLDGNGTIGFADLNMLLANWG